MNPPKISIVIPSFNKVNFIGLTLDSIFVQNYPNLEVIIQDGGSTDGTVEIIKKFAKKYPDVVKWESKKDKGQLDAIDQGFKKARGDILTFINADDIYVEDVFRTVGEACNANPKALWFAGKGKVIDGKSNEIAKPVMWYKNLLLFLNTRILLLITNYLMQPSIFFRKSAFQKYSPFTGSKRGVMEYDFWLRLSEVSMPIVINKNLSAFRMSGENISSLYFSEVMNVDNQIVRKYTKNPIILLLHDLHNRGRVVVNKFV